MVLYFFVPYFKDQIAFWIWVLVVYPCTLALDVALMLTVRPAAKTRSSAG
jgi:ABC-type multidrug transport system permease subunit